jgi:hypothetical protein
MPDYSKQLAEIVQALNRPSWPAWEVALFTSLLAFTFGLLGQFALMRMTDRYRRGQLRAHLYRDLAGLFFCVHRIMDVKPEQIPWEDKAGWIKDQLKRQLLFRGEKECLDNQRLYMQLRERICSDELYARFHRIVDELEQGPGAVNINTRGALRTFASYVHQGELEEQCFTKYLSKQLANSFLIVLDEYSTKQ